MPNEHKVVSGRKKQRYSESEKKFRVELYQIALTKNPELACQKFVKIINVEQITFFRWNKKWSSLYQKKDGEVSNSLSENMSEEELYQELLKINPKLDTETFKELLCPRYPENLKKEAVKLYQIALAKKPELTRQKFAEDIDINRETFRKWNKKWSSLYQKKDGEASDSLFKNVSEEELQHEVLKLKSKLKSKPKTFKFYPKDLQKEAVRLYQIALAKNSEFTLQKFAEVIDINKETFRTWNKKWSSLYPGSLENVSEEELHQGLLALNPKLKAETFKELLHARYSEILQKEAVKLYQITLVKNPDLTRQKFAEVIDVKRENFRRWNKKWGSSYQGLFKNVSEEELHQGLLAFNPKLKADTFENLIRGRRRLLKPIQPKKEGFLQQSNLNGEQAHLLMKSSATATEKVKDFNMEESTSQIGNEPMEYQKSSEVPMNQTGRQQISIQEPVKLPEEVVVLSKETEPVKLSEAIEVKMEETNLEGLISIEEVMVLLEQQESSNFSEAMDLSEGTIIEERVVPSKEIESLGETKGKMEAIDSEGEGFIDELIGMLGEQESEKTEELQSNGVIRKQNPTQSSEGRAIIEHQNISILKEEKRNLFSAVVTNAQRECVKSQQNSSESQKRRLETSDEEPFSYRQSLKLKRKRIQKERCIV